MCIPTDARRRSVKGVCGPRTGSRCKQPTPLVPGAVTPFEVELWPTYYVFLPGHRLRVGLPRSDFLWFASSLNRFGRIADLAQPRIATNRIWHTPAYPSRLRLPVQSGESATIQADS